MYGYGYGYNRGYGKNPYSRKRAISYMAALKALRATPNIGPGPRGSEGSRALFGDTWSSANAQQREARKKWAFYGKGDYRSFLKWGSRLGGAASSAALAYMGGGGVGGAWDAAKSGWNQGAEFSKLRGWGDYNSDVPTSGNQIVDGAPSAQISVNDDMTGDICFSHTEFLGHVFVTGGAGSAAPFQVQKYSINPGLKRTFPFLSEIAKNFTMYELEGCVFNYRPTSGESANSTNVLGKVIMATQYDHDRPAFANVMQMENYAYANSTKPSLGAVHGVETDERHRHGKMLYIRTSDAELTRKDAIFCDIGDFYIGTDSVPIPGTGGASTTVAIGELWISYKIRLSRSRIHAESETAPSAFITMTGVAGPDTAGGTARTIVRDTIGVSIANDGAVTFPAGCNGRYMITADFNLNTPAVNTGQTGGFDYVAPTLINLRDVTLQHMINTLEPENVSSARKTYQFVVEVIDPTRDSVFRQNFTRLDSCSANVCGMTISRVA